ncbi:YeeE/YedE thiosulfate transporter family protein [Tahibacter sp.]|uniref:YeeE/YedE thiosulfate transporter family protein n=1 Tax=Tahibacter sp. TaxID=2056211 RepID=UPI0028C50991|nr:YeeE/YedE thiosulfate transporter family protein [Tahibacter sp.]
MSAVRAPRAYADPYLAGASLGLVLLAAFVWLGRGLGASGAFASTATGVVAAIAPAQAAASPLFAHYLQAPGPWLEWLSFELLGVMIGSGCSAALAGRARLTVERAAGITPMWRLTFAFVGGVLMSAGAVFARGCTSGQALTGGALLSVGSWLFLGVAFAAAYALAPLLRRAWT